MEIQRLVKMANDISRFFEAEPDHDEAVKGVLGHISRFWDPRMRREIAEHAAAGGSGLTDLAREAVSRLPPVTEARTA
ncbi:MAG: formate dehydrogenase subunit delta [Betaproteobacteria bacterium]|nr:formate dehydrogenase subunit delta [Betaproteobacteria bacterium]